MTDVVRRDDYIRYLFILVAQPIELDARRARRIAKNVDCKNIIYGLTISSVSVKTPVLLFGVSLSDAENTLGSRDHVSG